MIETNSNEALQSFSAAKNVNAAIKHLLKNEGAQSPQLTKFAKNFRSAVTGFSSAAATKSFIENNYKGNEVFFLAVARYAHSDFLDNLIEDLVNTYGEEFNSTYDSFENHIEVKDRTKFDSIVQSVFSRTESALTNSSLPTTNFMHLLVYQSLFDANVLKEVLKLKR